MLVKMFAQQLANYVWKVTPKGQRGIAVCLVGASFLLAISLIIKLVYFLLEKI